MTTPATPSERKPTASADASAAGAASAVPATLEEVIGGVWDKYRNAILTLIGLVLAGILAKGGWDAYASQRQVQEGIDFAAASTPEALKAFAAAHSGDPIAGLAELKIGDESYAAGRMADAVASYEKAVATLAPGPFLSRAKLGLAVSELQAGRTSEGEAGLRRLSEDNTELKSIRTEATYQLASAAAAGGRAEEVRKLSEQLIQLDPSSSWTQRAFSLQANLPPAPAPAAAPAAPSAPSPVLSLPPTSKPSPLKD